MAVQNKYIQPELLQEYFPYNILNMYLFQRYQISCAKFCKDEKPGGICKNLLPFDCYIIRRILEYKTACRLLTYDKLYTP